MEKPAESKMEGAAAADQEDESITIQHLPEIVLLRIFSHFSLNEICTKIAPVCHQWNELSKHPSFWTVLKFDEKFDMGRMLEILSRATLLKKLSLRRVDFSEAAVDILTENCPLLEKFSAMSGKMCGSSLSKLAECCPRIVHLNLNGTTFSDFDGFAPLQQLTHMRELKVSMTTFSGQELVEIAKNCIQLERMDLEALLLTDDDVAELVIQRHSTLKVLVMTFRHLTDASFIAIGKCSLLNRLFVKTAPNMTDVGLLALAQLNNLQKLGIWGGERKFSSDGLLELFSPQGLKNLVELDLTACYNVNDEVLRSIANGCHQTLSWLCVAYCCLITDVGMLEIAEKCSDLEYLDIRGLYISRDVLIEFPNLLPKLNKLDLFQCAAATPPVLLTLYMRRPSLTVFRAVRRSGSNVRLVPAVSH